MPLSTASLGYALVRTDEVERGTELLERAIAYASDHLVKGQLSQQLAWLAEAYLKHGESKRALNYAKKALDIASQCGGMGDQAWAHKIIGDVFLAAPNISPQKAARAYRKALEIAEARQMKPLVAHCSAALGYIEAKSGSQGRAKSMVNAACELFEALGMASFSSQARAQLWSASQPHSPLPSSEGSRATTAN